MSPRKPDGWTPPDGDTIRAAVKAAGGRKRVARWLGVSEGSVGHWQTGAHPIQWPTWYTLRALVGAARASGPEPTT